MALNRLRLFAPYVLVLCATLYFYRLADRFVYDPQSGRLGPGAWPKILLVSLMLVCIFEIGRRALILAGVLSESRHLDVAEEVIPEALPEEQAHPLAVLMAVLVTVLYLLSFETLGFFLSTFLYTAALMWIGKFRNVAWNLAISFLFTFAFMFAFMRIIFVDLPIGVEPFAKLSTALMRVMGVH
ncbi:MAG: tripartite tricarboxylate transporter TctB family protein [Xanthobacteraceae bacterium]|jgi:putative tricarboxylic transport membrane protein